MQRFDDEFLSWEILNQLRDGSIKLQGESTEFIQFCKGFISYILPSLECTVLETSENMQFL